MGRPKGTTGTGDPNRIPTKKEVLAFFDERVQHYAALRKMYLADDLRVYRRKDGNLTYKKS